MKHYPAVVGIGDILVSTALLTERFACDLAICKGICCVEGESGAPLEKDEISLLSQEYATYAPYMSQQGRDIVEKQGYAVQDFDGEWVTPLLNFREACVYTSNKNGICSCAIEQAYFEGKTKFRKPISCWIYPIRIQQLSIGCALNYHQWRVCECARKKGAKSGVPVYAFLKEPIIFKFGEAFYKDLEIAANHLSNY